MDNDLVRVWQLIHELSDQLVVNQKITATLQSQASSVKEHASQNGTGFALRRFNVDLTKECFDSELERQSAQLVIENQTLLHENKQLSLLLKEYETTMETVMSKFRNHALAGQQHELTLTRHYEALLLARETQGMSTDLATMTNVNQAIARLSHHLRALLRSLAGEDPDEEHLHNMDLDGEGTTSVDPEELESLFQALDSALNYDGQGQRNDWALERECEIERLQKENNQLRQLLGIDPASIEASGVPMVFDRIEAGRHVPVINNRTRRGSGSYGSDMLIGVIDRDGWDFRPFGGAEPSSNQPLPLPTAQALQYQENNQQQRSIGGAPLQRAVELQPPGMRMNMQPRRIGMFGPQRSVGRGPPTFWGNQPSLPAPPVLQPERPWMPQGSDLNR